MTQEYKWWETVLGWVIPLIIIAVVLTLCVADAVHTARDILGP
jgi:hypothetical protein